MRVGRVTAVAWPAHAGLATALAEAADAQAPFPALGPLPDRPIRLILAPSRAAFDSLTRGRFPPWSAGAAVPATGTVVLLVAGPPDHFAASLRHELAHLALHWSLRRPLPLWFDEGYAVYAAPEWQRFEVLRLNLALAVGHVPTFAGLDSALRGGTLEAGTAYALAGTAVEFLARLDRERGLEPLVAALREPGRFEDALRATYATTEDHLEALWQREVRRRYGLLGWVVAAGAFWSVAAVLLVALAALKRRRARARRAQLAAEEAAAEGAKPPIDAGPTPG